MRATKRDAELAAAFKAARERLSPTRLDTIDRHEYICHALERANDEGEISIATLVLAKNLITDRLGKHCSLLNWIWDKHPELEPALCADRNGAAPGAKMQATRLAWLNSLIKEFGGQP